MAMVNLLFDLFLNGEMAAVSTPDRLVAQRQSQGPWGGARPWMIVERGLEWSKHKYLILTKSFPGLISCDVVVLIWPLLSLLRVNLIIAHYWRSLSLNPQHKLRLGCKGISPTRYCWPWVSGPFSPTVVDEFIDSQHNISSGFYPVVLPSLTITNRY